MIRLFISVLGSRGEPQCLCQNIYMGSFTPLNTTHICNRTQPGFLLYSLLEKRIFQRILIDSLWIFYTGILVLLPNTYSKSQSMYSCSFLSFMPRYFGSSRIVCCRDVDALSGMTKEYVFFGRINLAKTV